jgi:hypothetical protein
VSHRHSTPSSENSSPNQPNRLNRFQYSDDEDTPGGSPQTVPYPLHNSSISSNINTFMSPSAHGGGHNINLSYTDPSISASLSGGSESSTPSRNHSHSVIEETLHSPYHHPPPEPHSVSLFMHESAIPRPYSVSTSDPPGSVHRSPQVSHSSAESTSKLSPPPAFFNPNILPLELKDKQTSTESSSDFRSPYSAANISPPYPMYSAYYEPKSPPPPPKVSSISSPITNSLPSPEKKNSESFAPVLLEDDTSSTNNVSPPWPWIQYTTEEGWPYFYNQVTGESSWDYPEQSLAGENIGDHENSSLHEHSSGLSFQQPEEYHSQSYPPHEPHHPHQSQYDISDDSDLSSCTSVDIKTETNSFVSHSVSHQSGMVIGQKNKQGQSVLHIAAASGNVDSLSLLVCSRSLSLLF